MSKTTKTIIWLIVVIVVIGGVWILVDKKSTEEQTIKIGVILPLTGQIAEWGQWARNGFDLAVEEINSLKDYPYHLVLFYEDNFSTPKDGVSAFQKIVYTHNPSVIVGPLSSKIVLSVAPLAEENKIVLLTPGGSADAIRYAGDYIFRLRETGIIHGQSMADYIFNQQDTKKVGVLYVNAENGITYAEAFKERFIQLGGKIDFYEAFNEESTDFRTHLIKAKDKKIDALYVPGIATEIALILKQAKELGLDIQFLSSVGAENPKLIDIAESSAENLIYTYPRFNPKSLESDVQEFVNKYVDKYGEEPEFIAANSYDSIKILAEVFKKYGYNSEVIKNGLYKVENYNGVGGTLSFDEYGDVIKTLMLKTVKNGQFVPYE